MAWMTGVQLPAGARKEYFLFTTMSRLVLRPTQLVLGAKRQRHEADHSPPLPYTTPQCGT